MCDHHEALQVDDACRCFSVSKGCKLILTGVTIFFSVLGLLVTSGIQRTNTKVSQAYMYLIHMKLQKKQVQDLGSHTLAELECH